MGIQAYAHNNLPSYFSSPLNALKIDRFVAMGEQWGVFSPNELTGIISKCFEHGRDTSIPYSIFDNYNLNECKSDLTTCLENANIVYAACGEATTSNRCQDAKKKYNAFMDRMIFFKERDFSNCYDIPTKEEYSSCKVATLLWKDECATTLSNENCILTEKRLKDKLSRNFALTLEEIVEKLKQEVEKEFRKRRNPATVECEKAVKAMTGKKTSSENEVRKAFKLKALKAHPDKGGSTEQMRELNEAHDKIQNCFKDKHL